MNYKSPAAVRLKTRLTRGNVPSNGLIQVLLGSVVLTTQDITELCTANLRWEPTNRLNLAIVRRCYSASIPSSPVRHLDTVNLLKYAETDKTGREMGKALLEVGKSFSFYIISK